MSVKGKQTRHRRYGLSKEYVQTSFNLKCYVNLTIIHFQVELLLQVTETVVNTIFSLCISVYNLGCCILVEGAELLTKEEWKESGAAYILQIPYCNKFLCPSLALMQSLYSCTQTLNPFSLKPSLPVHSCQVSAAGCKHTMI